MTATQQMTAADSTAEALGSLRLRLRENLRCTEVDPHDSHVVLEDPVQGKFVRLGAAEYQFACSLDGISTTREVWEKMQHTASCKSLEWPQANSFARWLMVNQLAFVPDVLELNANPPLVSPSPAPASLLRWKIPLLHSDRKILGLVAILSPLFSLPASIIALVASGCVYFLLLARSSEFVHSYRDLLAPGRQLSLAVTWFVLKLGHELGHAVVCRRYGGEVREAGVMWLFFTPVAYVDVTSAWRFRAVWQRLHTAAAGIYVEFVVGAVAALVWLVAEAPLVRQVAADVILLATVTTLFFNANPLMRYDGYYLLADSLGIPNLSALGQRYASYLSQRYVWGCETPPLKFPERWNMLVKVYGVAAAIWRWIAVFGLIAGLAALFQGAGIVLALLVAVSWFARPVRACVRTLLHGAAAGGPTRLRAAAAVLGVVAIAISALYGIPWPLTRSAPAIVEYSPPVVLRAPAEGFVDRVLVVDGQWVRAGQKLVELRNEDLVFELEKLRIQADRLAHQESTHRLRGETQRMGLVAAEMEGVHSQLRELQERASKMSVVAPADGRVLSRRLQSLPGMYVDEGEELAVIGVEDSKQLRVSLSQAEANSSEALIGTELKARAPGVAAWSCRISRVDPRATDAPPDERLMATSGGPLAATRDAAGNWRLSEPRLTAFIELSPAESRQLSCGQLVTVSLGLGHRHLADIFRSRWNSRGSDR